MNKTIVRTWSRLMIAALMLITLIMTAPAVLAQDNLDGLCPCPDECQLQVNIVLPECDPPAPPPCDGCDANCDYPLNACVTVQEGDVFWVNAVIARPGLTQNQPAIDNVYADIAIEPYGPKGGCAILAGTDSINETFEPVQECAQGPFLLDNCFDVQDVWWKVKCTKAGPVQIIVEAWTEDPEVECLGDYDSIIVDQVEPECCPNLDVEIIECPEGPVMPGATFGVKANIHNLTPEAIRFIDACIEICGPAELVSSNPNPYWYVHEIRTQSFQEVGWTLRCTGGGDVKVTIDAEYIGQCLDCEVDEDSCCIQQIDEGELFATLSVPEKAGVECANIFDVTLKVDNYSKFTPVDDVIAELFIDGPAALVNGNPCSLGTISAQGCVTKTWTLMCTGPGDVELYATVDGFDHTFMQSVGAETCVETVSQEYPLMVTVLDPCDYAEYSVGQTFPFTYNVQSTENDELPNVDCFVGLDLRNAPCVDLANPIAPMVHVVPQSGTGLLPYDVPAVMVDDCEDVWQAPITCLMDCCYVDVTWDLVCTCSGVCDFSGYQIAQTLNGNGGGYYDCLECVPACPDHIIGFAYEGTLTLTECGTGWYEQSDNVTPLVDPWNATIRFGGAGGYRATIGNGPGDRAEYFTGGNIPWPNGDSMHVTLDYDDDSGVATLTVENTVYGDDPVVISYDVDDASGRMTMHAKTSGNQYGIVEAYNVELNGIPTACCDTLFAQGTGETDGERGLSYMVFDCVSGSFLLEFDLYFEWDGDTADEGPALQIDVERDEEAVCGTFAGDYDMVSVIQMDPPCLSASIQAYEGLLSDGSIDWQTPVSMTDGRGLAVGEYFTVVVPVANTGEAKAIDLFATINWTGPAALLWGDSATRALDDIPCHGATKVIYEFQCTGEGTVTFTLCLDGNDVNTCAPITCLDYNDCAFCIEQICLSTSIIQPECGTAYIMGDTFTIKADLVNNSQVQSLNNVYAKLCWYGPGDICLSYGQDNPVPLDVVMPGERVEATWQVWCCCPGDTYFWIEFYNVEDPFCVDIQTDICCVKQYAPGCVNIDILSPKLNSYDDCNDWFEFDAYVATGQKFSVTAEIFNSNAVDFTVEELDVFSHVFGDIEILNGPFVVWPDESEPGVLGARESAIVTWEVVCSAPGETVLEAYVAGISDMMAQSDDSDYSLIMQYPAAHLVVDITDYPTEEIEIGTDFQVTATICNFGWSDAWEAEAVLSVEPAGAVTLASGSYTKQLGDLIGYGVDECITVTWDLTCEQAGNATITVDASGYDEAGYIVETLCDTLIVPDWFGSKQVSCCELILTGNPGAPIQDRFVESDSVTVAQVDEFGGGGDPGVTEGNFDIQLKAGWNLVSMPWIIEDTDPDVVLADICDTLIAVYEYDPCVRDFDSFNPDPAVPDDLWAVSDGPGYWFLMDDDDVLPVLGSLYPSGGGAPPTYLVTCTGFNLIGPRIGETPITVQQWLGHMSVLQVLGFDADAQEYYEINSMSALVYPGEAYWVFFTETGERLK